MIDLHSLAPGTARIALIAWLRYLRWLAASHGGANPWPERKTAVVVTGTSGSLAVDDSLFCGGWLLECPAGCVPNAATWRLE